VFTAVDRTPLIRSSTLLSTSLGRIAPTVSIDLTRDLARLSEDELPVLDSRIVERLRLMRSARQLVELVDPIRRHV
jgi:hypothetical protein